MNPPIKITAKRIIEDTKLSILDILADKLKIIINSQNEKEIYFHDVITSEIDSFTPTSNRKLCMELIDNAKPEFFDDGLIDHSSLDRTFITSAYYSIEQAIFDDDFFQELQNDMNNETISKTQAIKILGRINVKIDSIKKSRKFMIPREIIYQENDTSIYVKLNGFDIQFKDFEEPYFKKTQMIDLHDGSLKILTSNKSVNQNAIVLEKKKTDFKKGESITTYRVYIMEKDKEVDINKFFIKYAEKSIGSHNGYNLDPREYINTPTKEFTNKKNFIYVINQMVKELN